ALKTLHIVGVVLFLGNITTGIFWKLQADIGGNARAIAQAIEGILQADRWFTQPGATLILVTGLALTWVGGYPFSTFWIWGGLGLFVASAVIFKLAVEPAQRRMLAAIRNDDRETYQAESRRWMWSGTIATLAPYLALVLMVTKP